MSDFLIYEQHEGVVTLTMNRPEIRNAIAGMEQAGEFEEVCDRINRDMTVGAVILTGAGKAFCAGGNVKDMRDGKGHSADTAVGVRDNFKIGIQRIPLAFHKLEAPLIGAVNGAAIGVGCDLAKCHTAFVAVKRDLVGSTCEVAFEDIDCVVMKWQICGFQCGHVSFSLELRLLHHAWGGRRAP